MDWYVSASGDEKHILQDARFHGAFIQCLGTFEIID